MVVAVAASWRRDHFKRSTPIFFVMAAVLWAAARRRPAVRAHATLAFALLAPLVPLMLPPPPPPPLRVKHFMYPSSLRLQPSPFSSHGAWRNGYVHLPSAP